MWNTCRLSITLYYLARHPFEELGLQIHILPNHRMPHLIYFVVVLGHVLWNPVVRPELYSTDGLLNNINPLTTN